MVADGRRLSDIGTRRRARREYEQADLGHRLKRSLFVALFLLFYFLTDRRSLGRRCAEPPSRIPSYSIRLRAKSRDRYCVGKEQPFKT